MKSVTLKTAKEFAQLVHPRKSPTKFAQVIFQKKLDFGKRRATKTSPNLFLEKIIKHIAQLIHLTKSPT